MKKRSTSTKVCSNCLEEFSANDMYTVARKKHRGVDRDTDEYYSPYCETCLDDTESYLRVIEKPIQK